jgi:hypothetical protein
MRIFAEDEAGPLWLLLESFLEWLGFWGRLTLLVAFIFALAMFLALLLRRKP